MPSVGRLTSFSLNMCLTVACCQKACHDPAQSHILLASLKQVLSISVLNVVQMPIDLPNDLVARFLDRKALLWLCQRAELSSEGEPHSDSTSLENAVAHYRSYPDKDDLDLASLYWEACWTESIVDLFNDAVSSIAGEATNSSPASQGRLPYRLTTDPDIEGQIDRRQILPIYEINGTSRSG